MALAAALLAPRAAAQGVNVDLGPVDSPFGVPRAHEGAATGQGGFWNALGEPFSGPLTSADGSGGVAGVIAGSSGFEEHFENDLLTFDGDEALLDDGARIHGGGGSMVLRFAGLDNGQYEVTTYAIRPASLERTWVEVDDAEEPAALCGGAFPGFHVEGLSYVRHTVYVDGGQLTVRAWPEADEGYVAGVQLVQVVEGTRGLCFGSPAKCPCDNGGDGDGGCDNSQGTGGGRLHGSGRPEVAADGFVLAADRLTATTPALFFEGSATVGTGGEPGLAFGDGLRCVGGSLWRLATKFARDGAVTYPGPGEPSVSKSGGAFPGDRRWYQVWYRNVEEFCTAGGFNLTNAVETTWL